MTSLSLSLNLVAGASGSYVVIPGGGGESPSPTPIGRRESGIRAAQGGIGHGDIGKVESGAKERSEVGGGGRVEELSDEVKCSRTNPNPNADETEKPFHQLDRPQFATPSSTAIPDQLRPSSRKPSRPSLNTIHSGSAASTPSDVFHTPRNGNTPTPAADHPGHSVGGQAARDDSAVERQPARPESGTMGKTPSPPSDAKSKLPIKADHLRKRSQSASTPATSTRELQEEQSGVMQRGAESSFTDTTAGSKPTVGLASTSNDNDALHRARSSSISLLKEKVAGVSEVVRRARSGSMLGEGYVRVGEGDGES